jgi:cation:H+ antiporter
MDLVAIGLLSAGFAALLAGAELLVRGASRLAAAFGISPLVVGLTVVAFGTSSPELAVGLSSSWAGEADIAVGNVVGSNVFNVLVVLGLSAMAAPLVVAQQLVRWDVPIMIGVTLLVWVLALDASIARIEGALLAGGLFAYLWMAIRKGREESAQIAAEYRAELGGDGRRFGSAVGLQIVLVVVGLVMLVVGADWLVEGAVRFARAAGLSELVIGLTIIAAGTSMPEVATSVVASLRGHRDIAVGNVVGSNLFNLLGILGLTALFAPVPLDVAPQALAFDFPVMTAVAIACLPVFFVGNRIGRWEGAVFVGYYVAYTAYLLLDAWGHAARDAFAAAMTGFFLPLTALTIAVVVLRCVARRRRDVAC